ncbi:MAG: hypothetical protein K8R92_09295 [Planctomycetes bacterium]|nr:hypothetical protein [Planctomycetota bacterium]
MARWIRGSAFAAAILTSTLLAAPQSAEGQAAPPKPERIRVMTLDLGSGSERVSLTDPERLDRARRLFEEFPADIVFVAHAGSLAEGLAATLHRSWIALPAAGAGLITDWKPAPAKEGELWRGLGARLVAADGREVVAFPIQFPFAPYQPYQVSGVAHDAQPFINGAEAAIESANTTRGLHSEHLAVAVRAANAAGLAVVAAGMVNEPSGADWSDLAVRAELCPMRIVWPTVRNLERAGLRDAYRTVHPNVVDAPGPTWPVIAQKRDRSDRIDFIFTNARLDCGKIEVLGEAGPASARHPKPLKGGLPGEHRALSAELEWAAKK